MDEQIPKHIGFIVDGNRRWAKSHGLPAYEGHLAGKNTVEDVLIDVLKRGVRYASAYLFSTENWNREKDEVLKIISLFMTILKTDIPKFLEHDVRLRVIGIRDNLTPDLIQTIEKAEQATADCKGGDLLICFNYGGQLEIVDAVKKIVQSGVKEDEITPELISENLYAPDVPPCDLIVRTSGEQRLSNFMLWRAAYSELMFIDKNWPDMMTDDVTVILEEYKKRNRRFGG